jgi:U3 small nucleolar RNA-associated protein 3
MAKKRKAGGRPAKQNSAQEFQAGRDHILLEEAPDAKRRRKMAEQGLSE